MGLLIIPEITAKLSAEECSTKISQLAECTSRIFHHQSALKVRYTVGKWSGSNIQRSMGNTFYTHWHSETCHVPQHQSVSILCTLPVTSCSAERSFSTLKRIKSAICSSMTTTGLTLLNLHHDIPINIRTAIDEFSRHPRRLQMSNILDDQEASDITLYFSVLLILWSCMVIYSYSYIHLTFGHSVIIINLLPSRGVVEKSRIMHCYSSQWKLSNLPPNILMYMHLQKSQPL